MTAAAIDYALDFDPRNGSDCWSWLLAGLSNKMRGSADGDAR